MLKGEAKTAYQRDYMRRKRAGLATATNPKPKEWEPSQRMVDTIAHWAKYPRHTRGIGRQVIDGLILDNDDSWWEACRRYKRLQDERRAERKADKEREKKFKEELKILRCSFCRESMTETGPGARWFGTGYELSDGTKVYDAIICEPCLTNAKKFLKQKKRKRR